MFMFSIYYKTQK